MSKPWMPLYIADYLKDTRAFSAAEHGGYVLLIMEYWSNGGLPADDAKLARIACMSPDEWQAAKPTIAAKFTKQWRHKRIDDELAKAEQISCKRRAAAEQKHSKKDAIAPTVHTSQETEETEETEEPKNKEQSQQESRAVAKATRPVNTDFESFWKTYPKRSGPNPKAPAKKLFEAFVKSQVDPQAMIAGARICAEKDRGKIGTEFIPQAVKWLRDRRWEDYLELAGGLVADRFEARAGSPEWAAWLSYWTRIGRRFSIKLLEREAEAGKAFVFPSQWPPDEQAQTEGIPSFLKRTA